MVGIWIPIVSIAVDNDFFPCRDGGKHDMYMGGRHSGGGSSNSSHGNGESYDDNFPELVRHSP